VAAMDRDRDTHKDIPPRPPWTSPPAVLQGLDSQITWVSPDFIPGAGREAGAGRLSLRVKGRRL